MRSRFLYHLQVSLIIFDLLTINIFFSIYAFLFKNSILFIENSKFTYLAFSLSLIWLITSWIANIYNKKFIVSFELFFKKSIIGVLYFLGTVVLCLLFSHKLTLLSVNISNVIFSVPLALLINRFIYLVIYRYFQKKSFLSDKVIVIGYNDLSKKIIHSLEANELNKKVIGICDEFENVHELYHYPVLSNIGNAFEVCKKFGATEIYSSIAPEDNPEIYKLMQLADQHCIHFKIVPDINVFINRNCHVDYLNDMPILSMRNEPLMDLSNRIKKRLFDFIFSLFVLIFLLSWLVPLVGLLIWLDSKGPVFFVQTRSGKANLKFSCIKFRSMEVNDLADEKQATKDDERFTAVGKILRRLNIDEFPQFLNVLKGEMSIVGPRPHMLKHTEEYSQINNQFMIRHFLKPGITGWAQVNGFRGEIKSIENLEGRIEHDIWYLENWSMWLDIKIVGLTIFNTLIGDEHAF